jgi:ABC-type multidrug transport system ATPase subunit
MNGEILGKGKLIHDHSNGNRQKIGIIGAMLVNPRVLILDEPFNYLDPSSQIVVAKLIREMNRETGATVLVSSHNLTSINDLCDRLLLLEKGHLLMDKAHVIDPMLVQSVCEEKGYYDVNVPIRDYDKDFIEGCLIEAWDKVNGLIQDKISALPF